MNTITKIILIAIGSISVILGTLGIFLPLLPTTPFLLLAAACYIRASKRMYLWLINNKYFGTYIRDYREKKALPVKTKIYSLTLLWLTIGYSTFFIINLIYLKTLLLIVASIVTWHILSLKSIDREE